MSNPEKPCTQAKVSREQEQLEQEEVDNFWLPTFYQAKRDIDEAFESVFGGGDE